MSDRESKKRDAIESVARDVSRTTGMSYTKAVERVRKAHVRGERIRENGNR